MLACANETKCFRLPRRRLKTWFRDTLRALGAPALLEAQLTFVTARRLRALYKHYGGINKATTILAFPWQERPVPGPGASDYLGEIYLAPSEVNRQLAGGESFTKALRLLLVHATLHLFGFDHATAASARRFERKATQVLTQLH